MCCLVSLGANTQDVVVLDPVAALGGGRHGPGGREAGLPLADQARERNGLTGAELGAQSNVGRHRYMADAESGSSDPTVVSSET